MNQCSLPATSAQNSSGRSIDWNGWIFLTSGHVLYSNRSRPFLTILEDRGGRHDFLLTPCSLKMFQILARNEEYHPSCHGNLADTLGRYGFPPDQISTTFNIFMNVEVNPEGGICIRPPRTRAGDFIVFRAEADLVVGLTACAHEETNGGRCKSIRYEILP